MDFFLKIIHMNLNSRYTLFGSKYSLQIIFCDRQFVRRTEISFRLKNGLTLLNLKKRWMGDRLDLGPCPVPSPHLGPMPSLLIFPAPAPPSHVRPCVRQTIMRIFPPDEGGGVVIILDR